MAGDRPGRHGQLSPQDNALWKRVAATVTPIHRRTPSVPPFADPRPDAPPPRGVAGLKFEKPQRPRPDHVDTAPRKPVPVPVEAGLDGHWDRRFQRGHVQPDLSVDLHGHTLASAHARLEHALDNAMLHGHRIILLITGKPRSPDERDSRGGRRGAIRAAVTDWLMASRHARHIASVRAAHPRHGGAGALYIVLKRGK